MKIKSLLLALIITVIVFVNANYVSAQDKKVFDNVSVGLNVGPLLYKGEIRQYDFYPVMNYKNEWGGGIGLTVSKTLNTTFGIQGQLLSGGIRGVNRDLGLYVKGNIFEYSLNSEINLSNILFSTQKDRKVTLYGIVGLGLVNFRTQLQSLLNENILINVQGYLNNGTVWDLEKKERTTELVIPMAAGLKYKMNQHLSFKAEVSYRNVNSDKLDAYPVANSSNDLYAFNSIGLVYKFISKESQDLEWQNPFEANAEIGGTEAKIDGLTRDADFDGVADFYDQEPATPEGVSVDGAGKSLDIDMDGVPDYMDSDPFTAKGATVDENGVELDTDKDGVPNSKDLEPNTKAGDIVNFQGIAISKSKNEDDNLTGGPNTSFLPSIYFAVNSSSINMDSNDPYSSENVKRLAVVAQILRTKSSLKLAVVGHADKSGPTDYNVKISQNRAKAVINHLVNVYGIDPSRLKLEYKGEEEPLANGLNYINRRVDFVVIK